MVGGNIGLSYGYSYSFTGKEKAPACHLSFSSKKNTQLAPVKIKVPPEPNLHYHRLLFYLLPNDSIILILVIYSTFIIQSNSLRHGRQSLEKM